MRPNAVMMSTIFALCALVALAGFAAISAPARAQGSHALAMHGEPRYSADFEAFDYTNPSAPKGGRLTLGVLGTFDNLNPLIVRGVAAPGVRAYVYESLMARALDEPFTLYGLLAQFVETPPDRGWVEFTLNPQARFSDGRPVRVEDVLFSHALLRDSGRPNHQYYYAKVAKAEKTGPNRVRFTFAQAGDREMPLIMGLMPVLPEHAVSAPNFEQTTLDAPIGSGPYIVARVDAGSRIVYRRDPDYWGRDLPVNRGHYNFDEIRYDFFRDGNAMFEAFKKGDVRFTTESDPGRWASAYDFPAARAGSVRLGEFELGVPVGMTGLVFNTRRPQFADRRVREALGLLFDFEWLNGNLFHGLYVRTQSYFDQSELSAHARPADERERDLLAPFMDEVLPAVMEGTHAQPRTDGSGRNRQQLRDALGLLAEAGYELRDGVLVDAQSGAPFTFEILAATRDQERLLLSYARSLGRAGIRAEIRLVDSAQYQSRKTSFDFDMIQNYWGASLSPGNEQSFRWSRSAADTEGSFNYPGLRSEAADAMIAAMLAAEDRESFVSAVRALDRVLISGNYVLPLFHRPKQWAAYWEPLRHPPTSPLSGAHLDTWWMEDPTEPPS